MNRGSLPSLDIYLKPTAKEKYGNVENFYSVPLLPWSNLETKAALTGGRKEDLLSPLPYTLTKTGHKNFALSRSRESILSGRAGH